jgi:suppressor of tumorigenicity protein 13
MDVEEDESSEPQFPPVYESGEDFDKAGDLKMDAADLVSNGNYDAALEKYTAAVLAAPPSALLYANRANVLLKLGRPKAAERDCDFALKENPDSAKALRIRGKARKELGKWEDALKDLSASQQIDFDEGAVDDLKFLTEKHHESEKAAGEARSKEKERLKKRAEEIRKAQEEAKKAQQAMNDDDIPDIGGGDGAQRGMPGGMPGSMPGGMPAGMEGMMGAMMSDPELMAEMQNPKVQAAFQELMSGPGGPMGLLANPAKLQQMMSDPEVGPVLQKLMGKMGGGMFGGMNPGGAAANSGSDEDIPNLDDLGDIDIGDLPDVSK